MPQHLDYRGRQAFLSNSGTWTNLTLDCCQPFGALNAGREIDDQAVLRGAQPSTKGSSIQTLRHMGVELTRLWQGSKWTEFHKHDFRMIPDPL